MSTKLETITEYERIHTPILPRIPLVMSGCFTGIMPTFRPSLEHPMIQTGEQSHPKHILSELFRKHYITKGKDALDELCRNLGVYCIYESPEKDSSQIPVTLRFVPIDISSLDATDACTRRFTVDKDTATKTCVAQYIKWRMQGHPIQSFWTLVRAYTSEAKNLLEYEQGLDQIWNRLVLELGNLSSEHRYARSSIEIPKCVRDRFHNADDCIELGLRLFLNTGTSTFRSHSISNPQWKDLHEAAALWIRSLGSDNLMTTLPPPEYHRPQMHLELVLSIAFQVYYNSERKNCLGESHVKIPLVVWLFEKKIEFIDGFIHELIENSMECKDFNDYRPSICNGHLEIPEMAKRCQVRLGQMYPFCERFCSGLRQPSQIATRSVDDILTYLFVFSDYILFPDHNIWNQSPDRRLFLEL